MKPSIAFIGLGHMGGPMSTHLVESGYKVSGFDLAPHALESARISGVHISNSATDAVGGSDVVITMLPSGRQLLELYQQELLTAAKPGTLFIDCSTVSVDDARMAQEYAVSAGHRAMDAPVSGGVVGAEGANLTFMVGGAEEDFLTARPILSKMGSRIVHCGGSGLGQATKICNNIMLAVSMIGVSEAFVLAERVGLSPAILYEVASNATGQCWALTSNCPVPGLVPTSPANSDYEPGFASSLMSKDLGLALESIESTGVFAPVSTLTHDLYRDFANGGGATKDFSGIIHGIRARSDAAP